MTIICSPDCVGEMARCCYASAYPMGLIPIPFSMHNLWLVSTTFMWYFLKDLPVALLYDLTAIFILVCLVEPYYKAILLLKRLYAILRS